MERVGVVLGVDGERRGAQRLGRDLASEEAPVGGMGRDRSAEQVAVESLDVEEAEEPVDRRGLHVGRRREVGRAGRAGTAWRAWRPSPVRRSWSAAAR